MFQAGDVIHYSGSGVCIIQEVSLERISRTRELYYVLKPLHQNTSVIYVPVKSEQLVAKMRPILTRDEVDSLIRRIDEIHPVWDDDINKRKLLFDELIRGGECASLIRIIKSLVQQRNRRQADGKTLHVSDENYLREAQRLLYDEVAAVLGKTPKEAEAMLKDKFTVH